MSGRWSLPQESLQSVTMAGALLSFALLSFFAGINSQPTLTQPASQSVNPGQTATISCSKSSGNWESYVYWVRQKPGQSPRFVHCNGCSSRGEGIPDRFTASASGNTGSLTITNVEAEDEADYYCVCWSDTGSVWVFGGGTQLTVSGQPKVSPSVHLYPPSQEMLKSGGEPTLVCLINGFYPPDVEINWLVDGEEFSSGVEKTQPTKQGDKYVASSYLTMKRNDWERHHTYICKVVHDGKNFEKVVKKSECC